jgi:type VI secretion system secreted protein Hcp
MAVDVYLQLDGIQGESAYAEHRDWIECVMVTWEVCPPYRKRRCLFHY